MTPESQRNEKWVKSMIAHYNKADHTSQKERQVDIRCWRMYNNQMATDRFDYFLKVGDQQLPAYPRHVPLQRSLIDTLVSQQIYRPFTFSVAVADKASVSEKWTNILMGYISDMRGMVKQRYYATRGAMQKIEMQMQQMQQFLEKEPESEEEAQQQMQVRNMLPDITTQVDMMKDALSEEGMITQKELKELDHYYRFTYKDLKEHLAQKVMNKLRHRLNVKYVSKETLLSQVVTGKQYLFVDIIDGEKFPRYEVLNPLKVTFPKISGIRKVQDGPWVKITDHLSFQQIAIEFGGEIQKKYGKDKLEELASQSTPASGTANFASTPYGDMDITGKYDSVNYAGSETGTGIKVERVFFKVPRAVSVKYSPNPHQEGEFFRHFVDKTKTPINGDEYNYSNGKYVDKKNEKFTYNKAEVERYNESEGEFVKTKYTNDIYEGVIINDDIFVQCRKKAVIRHPDRKSHVKLPVFGPSFADIGEQPYSIIWMTKDLQELYDFIHTQRELMLALAGTKTIFYDRGQKPGDLADDEFYSQMKKGIAFVETIDPATGAPKRSNFNQWSMVDLSVSASIQYLDNMLVGIEDTMGNIVGIPRARKGQVVNTDQVGTFQESINRAQLITEILYYEHDQIEAEALTHLLNTALKYTYRDGDEFEMNDGEFGRELVKIPPHLYDDAYVEVMVYNHSEEQRKMQELRDILSLGVQRGQIGMDALVDTWSADTVVSLKKKIEYFAEKAQELAQQAGDKQHQQAMELEKAKIQFAKEFDMQWKQMEAQIKQQALILEGEKAKVDAAVQERDLALKEKKIDLDAQLKAIELQNEQIMESSVLDQNERQYSVQNRMNAIQMQLDYIIKTLQLGEKVHADGLKHSESMKKISVDEKKAQKMTKEHVSDR